ncbi:MAG: tRNA (adenosine(37)-N6)-dimethylallyltransferase MiaA [Acaryochloridaceae cyanobacterium SU_2_1]|nr:tRNA (adenosine(37)-N6)-dimethylallyltransferase MiaA [Acaryochloridaceae cyanobacterium SU_2_1]
MVLGLIVICGPTATGKSSLALALAEKLGSPILSADSRQVYRHFDIGTAKPSRADQARIPHHLIDICSPRQTLTVAEYQQQAQQLITQCHAQGQVPLLVGGTGLYIRAIVEGLQMPRVAPQPELRSQLQAQGQPYIYQWLQRVDPEAAIHIHAHDQNRTLRALEVYYTTGIPLSQQQGCRPPSYPILCLGLDHPQPEQYLARLRYRITTMLDQGWLAEVEGLIKTYGADLPLLDTLGYREMKQYLRGEYALNLAIEKAILRTRQFAKRQRTWFRAMPKIHWLPTVSPTLISQAWHYIQPYYQGWHDPLEQ